MYLVDSSSLVPTDQLDPNRLTLDTDGDPKNDRQVWTVEAFRSLSASTRRKKGCKYTDLGSGVVRLLSVQYSMPEDSWHACQEASIQIRISLRIQQRRQYCGKISSLG